jgi:hypothetical protein
MKNIVVVLIVLMASHVMLNAIPDSNVAYVCNYVSAPSINASDEDVAPKMIQVWKAVKPIKKYVVENSDSNLPSIGPVKDFFLKILPQRLFR